MDCKVPLSKVDVKIFLECPGCTAPGIIVSTYDLKRTTFGYSDSNNNQRPETTAGADTLIPIGNGTVYLQHINGVLDYYNGITGDEFYGVANAYIQEGADNFTYASWQHAWGDTAWLSELYLQQQVPGVLGLRCTEAAVDYYDTSNHSAVPTYTYTFPISTSSPLPSQANDIFMFHLSDTSFDGSLRFYPNYRFTWKMKYKVCGNPDTAATLNFNNYMFLTARILPPDIKYSDNPIATSDTSPYNVSPSSNRLFICEALAQPITIYPIVNTYNETWASNASENCASPTLKLDVGYKINAGFDVFRYEFRLPPGFNGLGRGPLLASGAPAYFSINPPVGFTAMPTSTYSSGAIYNGWTTASQLGTANILYSGSAYMLDTLSAKFSAPFETFTSANNGFNANVTDPDPAHYPTVQHNSIPLLLVYDGNFNQTMSVTFTPICATVNDTTVFNTAVAYAVWTSTENTCNGFIDTVLNSSAKTKRILTNSTATVSNHTTLLPTIYSPSLMDWTIRITPVHAIGSVYFFIDSSSLPAGVTVTGMAQHPNTCPSGVAPITSNGYYIFEIGEMRPSQPFNHVQHLCLSLPSNTAICTADSIAMDVGVLWGCGGFPDYSGFNPGSLSNNCNNGGYRATLTNPGLPPVAPIATSTGPSTTINGCTSTASAKVCLANYSTSSGLGNIEASLVLPDAYSIVSDSATVILNSGAAHTISPTSTSLGDSIRWDFNIGALGQFGPPPSLIGNGGIVTGMSLCINFDVAGTCNATLFNGTPFNVVFTGNTECGNNFSVPTPNFYLNFTTCPLPVPVISADTANLTCTGYDTVTLVVSPSTGSYGSNVGFSWSNGMTGDTIYVPQADSAVAHTVTVSSDSGCVYMADFTVPGAFTGATISVTGNACQGGDTVTLHANTLNVNNGHIYQWSTGATTDSIHVVVQNGSTYRITVSNGLGCTDTASIKLQPISAPTITVTPAGFSCTGVDSISLIAAADTGVSYVWNTGDSTSVLIPDTAGIYIVTVTNAVGCQESDTVTVTNAAFTGIVVGTNVGIPNVTAALAASNPILPMPAAASNSQIVIVDGTFTIDQNYMFAQGSEVIARPGSLIIVESANGLTIGPGTYIHGCDTMWRGIEVRSMARLIMAGTLLHKIRIEDARYAVNLLNNCKFLIKASWFNNNYIGIYAGSQFTLPSSQLNIGQIETITACDFTNTTGNLKPLYAGFATNLGLPTPTFFNGGFCGIFLCNVNGTVRIGDVGYRPNIFTGLANGILCYQTNLTVSNSRFKDILGGMYYGSAYPSGRAVHASKPMGIAWWATPKILTFTGTIPTAGLTSTTVRTFENCEIGIWVDRVAPTIQRCLMKNVNKGIVVTNCQSMTITVLKNHIDAVSRGISLLQNAPNGGAIIDSNTILVNALYAANYGIEIQDNNVECYKQYRVRDNQINMGGSSVYGIWDNGATGYYFERNNIKINNPSYAMAGMYHSNGILNYILDNNVHGTSATANSQGTYPIAYQYAQANGFYMCNRSDSTYQGIVFGGACGDSKLKLSEIGSHFIGLHSTVNTGIDPQPEIDTTELISLQRMNTNKWLGLNYSIAAKNDNTPNNIRKQQITVHSLYSIYFPNVSWPVTVNYVVFLGNALSFISCGDTGIYDLPTSGGGGSTYFRSVMQDSIEYTLFTDETKWQQKWDVYSKCKMNTEALADDSLANAFVEMLDTTNMGSFYAINHLWQYADKDLPQLTYVDSAYRFKAKLNAEILRIDSLIWLDTTGRDLAVLSLTAQQLSDSVAWIDSIVQGFAEDIFNARAAAADSARTINNAISAINLPEENLQLYNSIYLNSLAVAIDTFTAQQKDDIAYLAFQCPLQGGSAVYLARAMYALLADTLFDDIALCDTNTLRMMRKPAKQKKPYTNTGLNAVNYMLYPNPAQSIVTVATDNVFCADCYMTVYDLAGRQVLRVRLPDGKQKTDIDIAAVQYGMYIVNIGDGNGNMYNTRLSIVR